VGMGKLLKIFSKIPVNSAKHQKMPQIL